MAKRARGTTTRPGQRRPMQRPGARPAASTARPGAATSASAPVTPPATLTPEEEARAAQLEAAIVAEERQAEAGRRARSERNSSPAPLRASSPLAAAAANEYAYVARDVRRVALVGGSLIGFLVVLWVVVQVTGVTL
jgi:hypothetical protein